MSLLQILARYGQEVSVSDEEVFDLFSTYNGSHDLGMVSRDSPSIELTIAGRDLVIHQSPGLLKSTLKGGTTGAVLWTITPLVASWLANPANFLWRHGLLCDKSCILELGAGITAVLGLVVADKVGRYILTDQAYVLKLLAQNLDENKRKSRPQGSARIQQRKKAASRHSRSDDGNHRPEVMELDWETSDLRDVVRLLGGDASPAKPVDVLVAVDCVFNEAIVEPLVNTLKALSGTESSNPVLSIVAQQLRSPEVFSHWLETMLEHFRVWRISEEELDQGQTDSIEGRLRTQDGYVVYACVLKCSIDAIDGGNT